MGKDRKVLLILGTNLSLFPLNKLHCRPIQSLINTSYFDLKVTAPMQTNYVR